MLVVEEEDADCLQLVLVELVAVVPVEFPQIQELPELILQVEVAVELPTQ
jgi:hypothetical protein